MLILAFDIGGTLIKTAAYDDNNGLMGYKELSYPKEGKDGIIEVITDEAEKYDFDGIGISTAGLVDEEKGSIIFSSNAIKDYTGTNLKQMFEEKYHKPVWVLNDVNAAAIGEGYFGVAKDYNDYICLTYGTGVGGAIVIDKKVYKGSNGLAGEIGHTVTHNEHGLKCTCGAYGCYNMHASTKQLVENCKRVDTYIENGRQVFDRFNNGDKLIINEVDKWIDEVVLGLVIIVHIFNPNVIIMGGGIMKEQYIIEQINQKLKAIVMDGYKNVKVISASLGNKAGLMGAVQFTMEKIK